MRSRASARSSTQKQIYKSSRAVPPISRRSKSSPRSKWRTIKAVLVVSGAALLGGCLYYPYAAQGVVGVPTNTNTVDTLPHDSGMSSSVASSSSSSSSSAKRSLARGVSGLPMDETPALVGASRGHITCDADVDRLVYWNEPQGQQDIDFKSPFLKSSSLENKPKYITFEPDRGGWNNIRMNLEFIFIFAAATGRTIVLPPASPLYLMNVSSIRHCFHHS